MPGAGTRTHGACFEKFNNKRHVSVRAEAIRCGANGCTEEQDMMAQRMTATSEALRPDTEERLSWALAAPLIGGLSLGLWLVIWRVAELVLAS